MPICAMTSHDSFGSDDVEMYNIKLLKSMKNEVELLWKDGDLFDITLEVDGQFIDAHKLMLASHSPYFKAMFCGQFQDAKKRSIELKGAYTIISEMFHMKGSLNLIHSSPKETHLQCAHFSQRPRVSDPIPGSCQFFYPTSVTCRV